MSLSKNTLKMYKFYNSKFLEFGGTTEEYLNSLRVSHKTYNLIISILEHYHGKIDIKRKEIIYREHIPIIISKSDVIRIIDNTYNKKHKLLLLLIYMTGMRPSEIINLKCADINNNIITIIKSKNHPDPREIIIDDNLKDEINKYINKKQEYLFEINGKQMSIRGLQDAIKLSGKRANIDNLNPRSLRHAYATHFLTGNIFYIKQQLGHGGLGSTEIYID